MRVTLMVIAAGALLAGAAQAKENQSATTEQDEAASTGRVVKVLYVCSEEERNWRAFSRDLGTPDFITAEQVRAQKGKAWAEPKCITPSEVRRLNLSSIAPVR